MSFWDLFRTTVGVDPGSENLRIVHADQIIFNEPSMISFDKEASKVSGFGNGCVVSKKHRLIRPTYFSIWDFYAFEMLLRSALKKGLNVRGVFRKVLNMYIAIPTGTNEIEKRAYRDSSEHANAAEVYMIHQSICAAISQSILFEKKHFILIDFSASKIEVTCFIDSLVYSTGLARMGTWKIYELVVNHLRRKYDAEVTRDQVAQALNSIDSLDDSKIRFVDIADHRMPVAELKASFEVISK